MCIAAIILVLLCGAVYASASIRAGVYVKALCRKRTNRRVVALTFDDGVDEVWTPRVLDVLRSHGVQAVFFLIGERARQHPDLVRRMVHEGHLLGNHSYGHKGYFPLLSRRRMEEELRRTDKVLSEIAGCPVRWFRPPFGVTNPTVAGVVTKFGYRTVGWNIRSLDTMGRSLEWVVRRIERRLKPGSVILLHDDRPHSDRLLEMVLERIEKEKYTIERLDKLFGIE